MRMLAWMMPFALAIALVSCSGSTSGAVTGSLESCHPSGRRGWWVCEGHFDELEGIYTEDFPTDFGSYPRVLEITVSVESGTLQVWFEASDGSTISSQATLGNPATLSGDVTPSYERFLVNFEAVSDKVTGVDYVLTIGP